MEFCSDDDDRKHVRESRTYREVSGVYRMSLRMLLGIISSEIVNVLIARVPG